MANLETTSELNTVLWIDGGRLTFYRVLILPYATDGANLLIINGTYCMTATTGLCPHHKSLELFVSDC